MLVVNEPPLQVQVIAEAWDLSQIIIVFIIQERYLCCLTFTLITTCAHVRINRVSFTRAKKPVPLDEPTSINSTHFSKDCCSAIADTMRRYTRKLPHSCDCRRNSSAISAKLATNVMVAFSLPFQRKDVLMTTPTISLFFM